MCVSHREREGGIGGKLLVPPRVQRQVVAKVGHGDLVGTRQAAGCRACAVRAQGNTTDTGLLLGPEGLEQGPVWV